MREKNTLDYYMYLFIIMSVVVEHDLLESL